jgi:hypothetical protein
MVVPNTMESTQFINTLLVPVKREMAIADISQN